MNGTEILAYIILSAIALSVYEWRCSKKRRAARAASAARRLAR